MNKIIIILFLLVSNLLVGQNFNQRVDFLNVAETGFNAVENDSGYIMFGGVAGARLGIVQVDFNGNIMFQKIYGSTTYGYYAGFQGSLTKVSSGGYAMYGGKVTTSGDYFSILFRFNDLGDTLWTKLYGDTLGFQTGRHMRQTPDGGFILLGENSNTPAVYSVIKTDSIGNIEWQQSYAGPQTDTPQHIAVCNDGGYIFTGLTRSLGPGTPGTTNILITKIDSLGNVEFTKVFGELNNDVASSIEQTQDGGFIFGGSLWSDIDTRIRPYVIRLDSLGDTVWTKTYTPPTGNAFGNGFRTIFELPDGNFIGAGQEFFTDSVTFGRRDGLIIKLKPNGDTLWKKTYRIPYMNGNNTEFDIKDLRQTSDGGFICGGVVYANLPDTGNQDMWIFKIDSNGCVDTSSCWVNVGITEEFVQLNNSLSVFPNPTSNYFTIEGLNKPYNLSIYNSLGQLLYSEESILESSKTIDVSNYSKGLIFIRIDSDGETHIDKLIKN